MRHVLAILAPALLGFAAVSAGPVGSGGGLGPVEAARHPSSHSHRDAPTPTLDDVPLSFDIDAASPLLRFIGEWMPAPSAVGRAVHSTITEGRGRTSVQLEVEGTGVLLYGSRDPPSAPSSSATSSGSGISVRDDEGDLLPSKPPSDGVLVDVRNTSFSGLEASFETASTRYTVSGATVHTHVRSDAGRVENVPIRREAFVKAGEANTAFGWSGEWRISESDGNGSDTEALGSSGAAVHIPVPAGSSFVVVRGSVGPSRGGMLVEWEPQISGGDKRISTSSWWSVPATLYMGRVDPHTEHNMSLGIEGDVGLDSVTFYSAWSMPSSTVLVGLEPQLANATATASADGQQRDLDSATFVARVLGGVVGGIGMLTLLAVMRTCWIRHLQAKRDEEQPYTAYIGSAPPSYTQHWAGGDGVASTSQGAPSMVSHGGSQASTSPPQAVIPLSPTVSITSPDGRRHAPRPSSPQPPRPHSPSSILMSSLHPLTPTASPGDLSAAAPVSPPRREAGPDGFPGHLDLPPPPSHRRVSFTSEERERPRMGPPPRLALERLQERTSEDSMQLSPRRGSLSRLVETTAPLSRRISNVGEPLARRISRATDQSEADVWEDIGFAPPTSTAAVLEGRRASRSSTERAGRGSVDSQKS